MNEHDEYRDVTTDVEFQTALRALVLAADANGVDVRGGWPVVDDVTNGGWDVEIIRLARQLSRQ